MEEVVLGVSDLVGLINQTLEFAYPSMSVVGELSNFRISKGKWVYFDLKDDLASVRFFGTVYNLPGPLEDGLMLQVRGTPRLHPLYNFSVTIQSISPVGEGSLKRAAVLLEAKLQQEGLFDPSRKRNLPYPPRKIALITSGESAAYADFIKVLNARWGGVDIEHYDTQVQGEAAIEQIAAAVTAASAQAQPADVLVITRGGGSVEDLAVFNTESLTRAVAASRIPTLVAIGHEVDFSLAELAADQRASTPSNAAELLTPDRTQEAARIAAYEKVLHQTLHNYVRTLKTHTNTQAEHLNQAIRHLLALYRQQLDSQEELLTALSPEAALQRGYAILRQKGQAIQSGRQLKIGEIMEAQLVDAKLQARIEQIELQ
jgi:exodeoxyribonuclease VII large subunit